MLYPEKFGIRSQDFQVVLHDAGQFYWGLPQAWLKEIKSFAPHSTTVELANWQVVDIDYEDDWKRAELLYQALKSSVGA